jgi:hypothetical protein
MRGDSSRISNCVFTTNDNGIRNPFGGTAQTLGNNLVAGNGTNVDGPLTPFAPE